MFQLQIEYDLLNFSERLGKKCNCPNKDCPLRKHGSHDTSTRTHAVVSRQLYIPNCSPLFLSFSVELLIISSNNQCFLKVNSTRLVIRTVLCVRHTCSTHITYLTNIHSVLKYENETAFLSIMIIINQNAKSQNHSCK